MQLLCPPKPKELLIATSTWHEQRGEVSTRSHRAVIERCGVCHTHRVLNRCLANHNIQVHIRIWVHQVRVGVQLREGWEQR